MKRAPALLLACALAASALPAARAGEAAAPTVQVTGIKDPEMRTYRSIAAGLDAFDAYHALAPQAGLRFRLMHSAGGYASAADGVTLRLAFDENSIPVPIDADAGFVIARSQAAFDADASFVLNQRQGAYIAWPDIRTPGLPANLRRLGDLRLECRVMVAIVKQQVSFFAKAAVNALMQTPDWCGKENFTFGMRSGARLAGASLHDGDRSQPLNVQAWSYGVPIGSPAWPDDALVELRYADAPAPVAAAAP
jgi:hypothetical protein